MAPGVQDDVDRAKHAADQRANEATLGVIVEHLENIKTQMSNMDRQISAIETHLGFNGGLGPESQRQPSQRTNAANAVRWVSNTWVRLAVAALAMMLSGAVMTGAVMSMVGTLISTGQWGPDDLRALLWW